MYCGKCGTKIPEGGEFCPNCGYKVERTTSTTTLSRKAQAGIKLPIVICVALIAVVGIIAIVLARGGGYKRTLDKYFKAYEENDPELLYSSVIAQYWIDYTNAGYNDNEAFEILEEDIEDKIDDWDCGNRIKITYEVENEVRATDEELEDLEEVIYDWYAYYVYDRDEFSITDAYVLDISFTVTGEEGTDTFYYPDGFLVIQENGEWRVPRGYISCSFFEN